MPRKKKNRGQVETDWATISFPFRVQKEGRPEFVQQLMLPDGAELRRGDETFVYFADKMPSWMSKEELMRAD